MMSSWECPGNPTIDWNRNKFRFPYKGKNITFDVGAEGNSIPIISHVQISKAMKKSVSAYLIFVNT